MPYIIFKKDENICICAFCRQIVHNLYVETKYFTDFLGFVINDYLVEQACWRYEVSLHAGIDALPKLYGAMVLHRGFLPRLFYYENLPPTVIQPIFDIESYC